MINLTPIFLTFKLAIVVTIVLLFIAIPLAKYLSRKPNLITHILKTFVNLPLVLPPTVLGFYLILFLNQNTTFGKFLDHLFGFSIMFSFEGLIVASIIYSLPFMVNPILSGFESVEGKYRNLCLLYGKSKLQTLLKVEIPLIKHSIINGIILTFAHTIGEFGVILMIGGNIPGETEVASIAIYKSVELLDYSNANMLSLILIVISIILIFMSQLYKQKRSIL